MHANKQKNFGHLSNYSAMTRIVFSIRDDWYCIFLANLVNSVGGEKECQACLDTLIIILIIIIVLIVMAAFGRLSGYRKSCTLKPDSIDLQKFSGEHLFDLCPYLSHESRHFSKWGYPWLEIAISDKNNLNLIQLEWFEFELI